MMDMTISAIANAVSGELYVQGNAIAHEAIEAIANSDACSCNTQVSDSVANSESAEQLDLTSNFKADGKSALSDKHILQNSDSQAIDPALLSSVTGMTWDSRAIQPGWLYVALPGERVDGHDFVQAAAEAGAACVLVSRIVDVNCPFIVVDDTMQALEALAEAWRECLTGCVIGLTGSTGKTTTKGLLRDVLSKLGAVVATEGNQNNELGVPRTILAASRDTKSVVVEMGMRGLGQISELCSIAKPQWGLITNIGESHMELLGSRDAIAQAKGELYEALPDGSGMAFINAADDYAEWLCEHCRLEARGISTVFYNGTEEEMFEWPDLAKQSPRVWVSNLRLNSRGYPQFTLNAAGFDMHGHMSLDGSINCSLALKGLHNVVNAVAAAAVGIAAGLDLSTVAQALENSTPESGRQKILRAKNGALVVDDAYNANPASMEAALITFAAFAVEGQRFAVLGDMGELGDIAEESHFKVGECAAHSGLDALICVGELSAHIADGARSAGMDASAITKSDTLEDALLKIESMLSSNDALLVKASHFMGFEHIIEGLVG